MTRSVGPSLLGWTSQNQNDICSKILCPLNNALSLAHSACLAKTTAHLFRSGNLLLLQFPCHCWAFRLNYLLPLSSCCFNNCRFVLFPLFISFLEESWSKFWVLPFVPYFNWWFLWACLLKLASYLISTKEVCFITLICVLQLI